jgi:succinate dehydrogenase / fumarate reductase flavoprotein subunit
LKRGLEEVRGLRAQGLRVDGNGLPFALETLNVCGVAQMVMTAASMRTESRGPHLFFEREDDVQAVRRDDENWCKYIVLQRSDGRLVATPQKPTGPSFSL